MQYDGNNKQPVLIIAGMHRSGTSLTASLLQSAGLDVGKNLLGESPSNLKGHFENLDFFDFHQGILHSMGTSEAGWTLQKDIPVPEYYVDAAKLLVQKSASSTQPWGWKDPRTTLFLDFWSNLIPTAKFVFVYRSPWEVIDSLYRRGDDIFHYNPQLAIDLWTNYNQLILDFYNRFADKCFLMHLNQITSNPTAFIESVSQRFHIPLQPPKEDIYDAPLLKTQASYSQRATLIQRYFPEACDLYQQLNATANFSDDSIPTNQALFSPTAWLLKDWLDVRGLSNQVVTLERQLSSSQAELVTVTQERQRLQDANRILQEENHTLQEATHTLQEATHTLQEATHTLQEATHTLQVEISTCTENREQLKDKVHELRYELEHAYAAIAAMETSKFWKLRTQWIQLKRRFRL
jgi:hypothetical protein